MVEIIGPPVYFGYPELKHPWSKTPFYATVFLFQKSHMEKDGKNIPLTTDKRIQKCLHRLGKTYYPWQHWWFRLQEELWSLSQETDNYMRKINE